MRSTSFVPDTEDWLGQLANKVDTADRLRQFIDLTPEEERAIATTDAMWSTTPYFASLMDRKDPSCPIRRQVVPALAEARKDTGIPSYLIHKENRREERPDTIARQYRDRVAFTITRVCAVYCRYCFRREMTIDHDLELHLQVDEGLRWIASQPKIRDVLITGGDPFHLGDKKLEYVIRKLREIPHVEMIRFGTRMPIVLPQRITPALCEVLGGYHRVPIWLNTHANHPRELTERVARAAFDLLRAGVSVGNQAVLLKGINDDVATFRELHLRLLQVRIRPYYLFHCEPVPGVEHFRVPLERGAQLIKEALRGHHTGMAQPLYVVATKIGKIPLMDSSQIVAVDENFYTLRNHEGETTKLPRVKDAPPADDLVRGHEPPDAASELAHSA